MNVQYTDPEFICKLTGVREYCEGHTVELWRNADNGRLVIKAWNEAGCNSTEVDLLDLIQCLKTGPQGLGPGALPFQIDAKGDDQHGADPQGD